MEYCKPYFRIDGENEKISREDRIRQAIIISKLLTINHQETPPKMFWLGIKTQLLSPLATFNILKNLSYSKIHLGHNVIDGVVLSI